MRLYVHAPRLAQFDYGPSHPFRLGRLALAHDLIKDLGLLSTADVSLVEAEPAAADEVLAYHERGYVEALRQADAGHLSEEAYAYGLGSGDNPVFPGIWRYCLIYTGATLAAAASIASGRSSVAYSMSGGLHHAHADRASGFCYVNDPVLGIMRLLRRFDRVLYLDVDAHHGDGVQEAFYRSNRVLTISFHESGRYLFPGTGFEADMGEGEGRGFSINFPLLPGVGDRVYLECLRAVAGAALERFKPGAVVAQLGADSLRGDPLAHLSLSNRYLEETARFLVNTGIPLVALGGGGYDIDNVARAWTLVWAALAGATPPDGLPQWYLKRRDAGPGAPRTLRDPEPADDTPGRAREDARKVREYLLEKVVPLIHAGGGKGRRE